MSGAMEKFIKLTTSTHQVIYVSVSTIVSFTKGPNETTVINTVAGTQISVKESVESVLDAINE
jgi:uncharacterized protein YlzI (FlbEa/FlbD family)